MDYPFESVSPDLSRPEEQGGHGGGRATRSERYGGLVLGLSALLQQALRGEAERAAFPLLAGGIMLVLLRGQVGIERYRTLRRSLGFNGGRRGNHALALLYMLTFFFATAIVATLLACGAALLIGAIVHS